MKMLRRPVPSLPMGAPPPDAYGAKDMFTYAAVLNTGLATGTSGTASFNVDNDSDFLWTKGTQFALIASAAVTNDSQPMPGVTITIKDTTSGRDIMTTPVPIPALFGTGQLPFIMPVSKLLPRRSTIVVSFSSLDNASYSYIGLFFHGPKLFG